MNTLEQLLVLHVTPAGDDDHCEAERLARTMQTVIGDQAEIARVDQGYAGERAANAAAGHGIVFTVVNLSKAKRSCMLLPRRRVVERSFASVTCFGCLTKNGERYAGTLARPRIIAFTCPMIKQPAVIATVS